MEKVKIIQTIKLDKEQCRGMELYYAILIGLGEDGCLYALKNISSNQRSDQLTWEKLNIKFEETALSHEERFWGEND